MGSLWAHTGAIGLCLSLDCDALLKILMRAIPHPGGSNVLSGHTLKRT